MFNRRSTHRPMGRAMLALVTLVASLVLTSVPADAITVSGGVIGGFQVEGNEAFDDPGIGGIMDWATQVLASEPNGTLTVIQDDTADSGFTGSHEQQPSEWACAVGGDDPPKSNILTAFINPRIDEDGIFLDLAFIRKVGEEAKGKGDVHLNFEFNQQDVDPPGPYVPGECPIERADGDMLVAYDFPGGDSPPSIDLYVWDSSLTPGPDEGTWVLVPLPEPPLPVIVAGAVNAETMTDTVGSTPEALSKYRFGEASLDLTTILGGLPTCVSFGSANVRSRSSTSISSSLQDKLPTTPIDFSTCGQIDLVKRSDTGEAINGAKFQLYKSANDVLDVGEEIGGECTTPGSISAIPPVLGDPAPPTPAAGVCKWTDLITPGTYWVVETAPPAGYTIDADSVVGPINLAFRGAVTIDGIDVDGDQVPDGFVNIRWQYRMTLTPPEDTNLINNNHTFTATLEVSTDGGSTWLAANGQTLTFALKAGSTGVIVSDSDGAPATSCVTVAGVCMVTISSANPGDSTLIASFADQNITAPVSISREALKHWVNYRIVITPSATNRVGATHHFTVTLEKTTNGTTWTKVEGENPTITRESGPGTFSNNTCDDLAGTNSLGQCTIDLSSGSTGETIVKASYDAVVSDTRATFSSQATKRWVDYTLTVTPTGINHAGVPHDFTVRLVQLVTGGAPLPMVGEPVTLEWVGPGSISPLTCVTNTLGECLITASSSVTGIGTLTASVGHPAPLGPGEPGQQRPEDVGRLGHLHHPHR